MRRFLVWLAVLAIGVGVLTDPAFRRRQIIRRIAERVEALDRYVDIGVVLRTVVSDPDGDELIEGKPPLRVVRERKLGGIVDTKAHPPRMIGPSRSPRIWYASEEQEAALLHSDPKKLGQLIYGSEGAGKTRLLGMWHYVRWLENFGERREGGQTAPTSQRLEFIREEMIQLFAPNWYRYEIANERFVMCDGTRIQLVSTYRQSQAQGSPIQGFNWSWCGRDEAQDQIDVHEDIESRGRAARDGQYKQLATATAKDDSDWRTLRDRLVASGQWIKRELSIFRSPFITRVFLETKKASMSLREFLRRYGDPITGLIGDLPPERADYPSFSRGLNLVTIPKLGWDDVTRQELAAWGPNFAALAGHDPGSLFDVTLILRAYRINRELLPWERRIGLPKMKTFWVVIDEITTEQTTTEQHVAKLISRIRTTWQLNQLAHDGRTMAADGKRLLVRADPYGNNDTKTDKTCYTIFRNAGITIHPAAYNQDGDKPGRVPKREGIELVDGLFCNVVGERRMFIALDERGEPVAPNLVKAIESNEKNEHGESEIQRKDKHDLSHWTATLRYAVWAIERPRLQKGVLS